MGTLAGPIPFKQLRVLVLFDLAIPDSHCSTRLTLSPPREVSHGSFNGFLASITLFLQNPNSLAMNHS
ncbi:hypothetical protein K1719_015296 [Acacia pycnantha]|nr:hypothetical protein K1719_015296 [Acacia pycnantha]